MHRWPTARPVATLRGIDGADSNQIANRPTPSASRRRLGVRVLAEQGWLTGDPLGVTALPLWFADGRKMTRLHGRFPWQADLLITLPWPIDLIGNRSNLFDTVNWWDDAVRSHQFTAGNSRLG